MYLVEEHKQGPSGEEHISYHTIVKKARDEKHAFILAAQRRRYWRITHGFESLGFYFAASELEEIDKGYRWAASDGSTVAYEVRRI